MSHRGIDHRFKKQFRLTAATAVPYGIFRDPGGGQRFCLLRDIVSDLSMPLEDKVILLEKVCEIWKEKN